MIKEKKAHRKYFWKATPLTAKENKLLDKYKQEYEPIKKDELLTNLKDDQWEIEDIAKSATQIVYDTPIPSKSQRQNLKSGNLVKIKLITEEQGETEIERIWIRVTGENDGLYSGEIDNDTYNEKVKYGQAIWFHPNHVFQIDGK